MHRIKAIELFFRKHKHGILNMYKQLENKMWYLFVLETFKLALTKSLTIWYQEHEM